MRSSAKWEFESPDLMRGPPSPTLILLIFFAAAFCPPALRGEVPAVPRHSPSPAAIYDALFAFGDSLTDTGRDPAPGGAYFQSRFSNGPLWIEFLSTRLGLTYRPENNYAEGGANTMEVLGQAQQFVPERNLARSLFVVWAGGIEFLTGLVENNISDSAWNRQVRSMVNNIGQTIELLHEKGARTILVPNTVNLGAIPLLRIAPGILRNLLQEKIIQFNGELLAALRQIEEASAGLQIIPVDVHARFAALLQNPAASSFKQVEIDALGDPALLDKSFDGPGSSYLFWDPIHPTSQAHALVAEWFAQALEIPRNPSLRLVIQNQRLLIRVEALKPGSQYALQHSSDLETWNLLQSFSAQAAQFEADLGPVDGSRGFYRLLTAP